MDQEFRHCEITAEQWLSLAKKIPTKTMSPWVRVSNNIFYSQQWIGSEVITRTDRKYFGLFHRTDLICGLGTYFLSDHVIRTRSFYCEPQWRKRGLMRLCLEESLKAATPRARRALAFVSREAIEFHLRCGFDFISNVKSRRLGYFDFNSKKNIQIENDEITIMERIL